MQKSSEKSTAQGVMSTLRLGIDTETEIELKHLAKIALVIGGFSKAIDWFERLFIEDMPLPSDKIGWIKWHRRNYNSTLKEAVDEWNKRYA